MPPAQPARPARSHCVKRIAPFVITVGLASGVTGHPVPAQQRPATAAVTADVMKGIPVRSLGPGLVTGRIADIEIDPNDSNVWYVASAFGGLWKTVNRGVTFAPILDSMPAFNLCCVEVDPRNSSIVWVGTGENHSQRSAHFGDGV